MQINMQISANDNLLKKNVDWNSEGEAEGGAEAKSETFIIKIWNEISTSGLDFFIA